MRQRLPRVVEVVIIAAIAVLPVSTQDSSSDPRTPSSDFEVSRQIVFGLAPFDGGRYLSTFAPESRETIYVTADYQHVVTVNLSDIYYWPITAEWRADFGGFNRRLQGTLRVLQDDRVVQTLEQRRFIYVYPHGPAGEATRILSGGEMERFMADRAMAMEAYADGRTENPPTASYQGPFEGFVVSLESGKYWIEYGAERDGRQFSLSKELVVFDPLDRGVRYEIIPQDRWTASTASDSPHKTIFMRVDQVVYVKTYPAYLYNRSHYDLMSSPQSPVAGLGLQNSAVWVATEESYEDSEDATIELSVQGQRVPLRPRDYIVSQLRGTAFGYEILEYTTEAFPDRRPSFRAYRVTAPPLSLDVRVRSPAASRASDRSLATLDPSHTGQTALGLLLPLPLLAIKTVLIIRERRRRR